MPRRKSAEELRAEARKQLKKKMDAAREIEARENQRYGALLRKLAQKRGLSPEEFLKHLEGEEHDRQKAQKDAL